MSQLYVSVDQCVTRPELYKFCTENICVAKELKCPCQYGVQYRCRNGDCIYTRQVCDGKRDCSRGEDEASCPGRETTPTPSRGGSDLPLVVTVVSVCLIVCVVALVILCVFLLKRRLNNTSTESQSATEPLKNRYPSQDPEFSDSSNEHARPRPKVSLAFNNKYDLVNSCDKSDNKYGEGGSHDEYLQKEHRMNLNNKQRKQRDIVKPVGIYDLDLCGQRVNKYDICKKGDYTFKPREGKSSQIYVSHTDPELLKVVHSYKHGPGEMSMPHDLDLAIDMGQFSHTFATELLCASTPRQTVRNLVKLDVVDIDIDDDNNHHEPDRNKSRESAVSRFADSVEMDTKINCYVRPLEQT